MVPDMAQAIVDRATVSGEKSRSCASASWRTRDAGVAVAVAGVPSPDLTARLPLRSPLLPSSQRSVASC